MLWRTRSGNDWGRKEVGVFDGDVIVHMAPPASGNMEGVVFLAAQYMFIFRAQKILWSYSLALDDPNTHPEVMNRDAFVMIRNLLETNADFFLYTKIQFIRCRTTFGNAELSEDELKTLCQEGILRVSGDRELRLHDLLLTADQISAFNYITENPSDPLTSKFAQTLYRILDSHHKAGTNCPKEFFKAYPFIPASDPEFSFQSMEYLPELYEHIIYGLGTDSELSYAFAGFILFKECMQCRIPPFPVNGQAAQHILTNAADDEEKRESLSELFCEEQAEYIQTAIKYSK